MGVTKAPHCYLSISTTWQSFLGSDLGIVLVENKHSALLFSDSSFFFFFLLPMELVKELYTSEVWTEPLINYFWCL